MNALPNTLRLKIYLISNLKAFYYKIVQIHQTDLPTSTIFPYLVRFLDENTTVRFVTTKLRFSPFPIEKTPKTWKLREWDYWKQISKTAAIWDYEHNLKRGSSGTSPTIACSWLVWLVKKSIYNQSGHSIQNGLESTMFSADLRHRDQIVCHFKCCY